MANEVIEINLNKKLNREQESALDVLLEEHLRAEKRFKLKKSNKKNSISVELEDDRIAEIKLHQSVFSVSVISKEKPAYYRYGEQCGSGTYKILRALLSLQDVKPGSQKAYVMKKEVYGADEIEEESYESLSSNESLEEKTIISPEAWKENIQKEVEMTNLVYLDSELSPEFVEREDGTLKSYVVAERIAGKTILEILLAHQTNREPLVIEEIFRIIVLSAAELKKAHDKKVVHRDIKSDNMMCDLKNNQTRLIDFGFAYQHNAESDIPKKRSGSLLYVAPEQQQTEKSDVFSFGVLVLQVIGVDLSKVKNKIENQPGVYPYSKEKAQYMLKRFYKKYHAPANAPYKFKERLGSMLKEMLAENPTDRPTAEEVDIFFYKLYKLTAPLEERKYVRESHLTEKTHDCSETPNDVGTSLVDFSLFAVVQSPTVTRKIDEEVVESQQLQIAG